MSKRTYLLTIITLLVLVIGSERGQAQENVLLVKLQEGESSGILGDLGKNVRLISKHLNIYAVPVGSQRSSALGKRISSLTGVDVVQPNRKLTSRSARRPNDALFDLQWNLEKIGAPDIWDQTTGGQTPCGDEIVVAVFDDGFDLDHPEFEGMIWENSGEIPNNSFDDDGNGITDDYFGINLETMDDRHEPDPEYHGPGVASVIGVQTDNMLGTAGINWNIKMMLISSFEKDEAIALQAFEYILDQRKRYNDTNGAEGAYVVAVNNSWGFEGGFEEQFPLLCAMFDAMGEQGILSIGATENDQVNTDFFGDIPSDCSSEFLIVVTNTTQDDELSVAGFGKENVDLGAPGEAIQVVNRNEGNRSNGGTSFAAPHVSGAVALLYSLEEGTFCSDALISPADAALSMKRFILDGVTPIADLQDRTVTGGRLNLTATVDMITGVRETTKLDFTLAPNPTADRIYIRGLSNIAFYTIVNSLGQTLVTRDYDFQHGVPVNELPSGTFTLTIFDGKTFASQRFVKL